jgi:hypothetical protein
MIVKSPALKRTNFVEEVLNCWSMSYIQEAKIVNARLLSFAKIGALVMMSVTNE